MGILFSEKPEMFGGLHLALLAAAILLNAAVLLYIRGRREDQLLRLLWALGLIMMISEVFKQWFCYTYMYGRQANLTYFPWQLCSVAMYLSFSAIYLKGRAREAVLVYLSTFSLLGAVMALIYPEGMLLEQAVFTIHSFIYHALIISEAMIAVAVLRKGERPSFSSSLPLFGLTAVIAEMINLTARAVLHDAAREPDMFYINPYFITTQPVFRDIARRIGTAAEIIVYLLCVVLGARLIFLAEDRLFYRDAGGRSMTGLQRQPGTKL